MSGQRHRSDARHVCAAKRRRAPRRPVGATAGRCPLLSATSSRRDGSAVVAATDAVQPVLQAGEPTLVCLCQQGLQCAWAEDDVRVDQRDPLTAGGFDGELRAAATSAPSSSSTRSTRGIAISRVPSVDAPSTTMISSGWLCSIPVRHDVIQSAAVEVVGEQRGGGVVAAAEGQEGRDRRAPPVLGFEVQGGVRSWRARRVGCHAVAELHVGAAQKRPGRVATVQPGERRSATNRKPSISSSET